MIVFAADLHLTPRAWTNRWSVEGDSFESLRQLRDFVRAKPSVEAVVLAGDTTDSNTPDAATLYHLSHFMWAMRERGVPVYYVTGQHDRGAYGHSVLETYGGVHIDGMSVLIGDVTIHGLSYRSRTDLLEALADVPECDWLVMHGAFRHLLGFQGAWQLEGSDVPEHVANVFVGDIHKRDVSEFGELSVFSPGSAYATNASEIKEEHGFYALERRAMTYHPFKTRRFASVDLTEGSRSAGLKELAALNAKAFKEALPPVIFVRIERDAEVALDKFDKVVTVRQDAALRMVDASEIKLDAVKSLELKGSLDAVVDREREERTHAFLEGLLDAGSAGEYVSKWLDDTGVKLVEK